MISRLAVTHLVLLALLALTGCASPPSGTAEPRPPEDRVEAWIRERATVATSDRFLESIAAACRSARVIGLGETTHGQEECFAHKRRITMHLVREHGFRYVGYETNGVRVRAANDFILGRTDDPDVAVGGLGLLIWMVEENRQLLLDLRAWNESASEGERVEIFGFDVQDPRRSATRLAELIENEDPQLAEAARTLCDLLVATREASFGGDRSGLASCLEECEAFLQKTLSRREELATQIGAEAADEVVVRAKELVSFPIDPQDPCARERGMAAQVLHRLEADPEAKIALWGHNGHLTKGPLRWMRTEDLGLGGLLRERLGDGYFAVGFVYGQGSFGALHRDEENRWWFRSYADGAGPEGSLGRRFTETLPGDAFLALTPLPSDPVVEEWLRSPQGIRAWGGYGVPEDPEARTRPAHALMQIILADDFDGILFLHTTSAAVPLDRERVWAPKEDDGQ